VSVELLAIALGAMMIVGVFKVFFSTDAQNQKAKRRRKLLEQERSAQREFGSKG
jgi:Tfp pilus assembly protein PilW